MPTINCSSVHLRDVHPQIIPKWSVAHHLRVSSLLQPVVPDGQNLTSLKLSEITSPLMSDVICKIFEPRAIRSNAMKLDKNHSSSLYQLLASIECLYIEEAWLHCQQIWENKLYPWRKLKKNQWRNHGRMVSLLYLRRACWVRAHGWHMDDLVWVLMPSYLSANPWPKAGFLLVTAQQGCAPFADWLTRPMNDKQHKKTWFPNFQHAMLQLTWTLMELPTTITNNNVIDIILWETKCFNVDFSVPNSATILCMNPYVAVTALPSALMP